MDANAGNDHDADLPAAGGKLTPAELEIWNAARSGILERVPLDGSVVFAWIEGESSRRLHFAGDPLVVLPELEHTEAY
ncbi:hypothetical protein [Arthrobacter globiformis]|nr:hypothetical protein [Arthrobacter globiformis]